MASGRETFLRVWLAFTVAWSLAHAMLWLDFQQNYAIPGGRDSLSRPIDLAIWVTPPAMFYVAGRSVMLAYQIISRRAV